jgi:ribosomal protein S18 acetylase RimI-like enzyme
VLDDNDREQRIRRLFGWYLRRALPLDLSHTTAELSGAALWMGPGQWRLSPLQQALLLPEILRVVGLNRAMSRIAGVDAFQRKPPRAKHYYLAVLGVEPTMQGRGIGSALLLEGLHRCDRTRTAAYLETATERNLPLYERHGFRITREVRVPFGGPQMWLMWREPQTLEPA